MAIVCAGFAPPAHAQGLVPQQTLAGPSTDLDALSDMSIAHDGSGGAAFLQNVDGVAHLFVSRLVDGTFQTPQQIDAGLMGPAADAQIAADTGGHLVVTFIEDGALYASQASSAQDGFTQPQQLASAALNDSLSINRFGDGYLAFTTPDGSGDDVDVYSYNSATGWAAASPETMNESPGDAAGSGTSRPSVTAAQDGVGIVAWGENGHVYSRRVWGTATSVETEQLDPNQVGGDPELSADLPEVGVGGNSSYVDIVFREQVANPGIAGGVQSRVLLGQLVAEDTEPAIPIDGLSASTDDDADAPNVSLGEFGSGFATTETPGSGGLSATLIGTNGNPGTTAVVAYPGGGPDFTALTSASNLIAWQQPESSGEGEIYAASEDADGTGWNAPEQISSDAYGAADGVNGLQAGGDGVGDTMIAWLQDSSAGPEINYAELLEPPGASNLPAAVKYSGSATPTLTWPKARQYWGPLTYTITMDGIVIGQSQTNSFVPPAALADGPHAWAVTATNSVGEQSVGSTGTLFVDTIRPRLAVQVNGSPRAGTKLTLQNVYSDGANPSEPGSVASGIAAVSVTWGDGSKPITARAMTKPTHTYRKAGVYKLTVTATDHAGNATTVTRTLKIGPALKLGPVLKPSIQSHEPSRHRGIG